MSKQGRVLHRYGYSGIYMFSEHEPYLHDGYIQELKCHFRVQIGEDFNVKAHSSSLLNM